MAPPAPAAVQGLQQAANPLQDALQMKLNAMNKREPDWHGMNQFAGNVAMLSSPSQATYSSASTYAAQ